MKLKLTRVGAAVACAGLLTIYGCGGGGGGSGGSTFTNGSVTLSGLAATGLAFAGGIITVTDATGATVGTSSAVGADGSFSITLAGGAVAPFVLTATRSNADGTSESLVSVATAGGSVNISPVTNLIAARLSSSGDPLKLATELASGASTVNASTVSAKVTEVATILAPILAATGTSGTDPFTGTFATDGTGYDRLLDSIKVTITPASSTSTNIEVGLKVNQGSDSAAPLVTQFSSSAATPPALPSLGGATLLPSGTAALIQQHLDQLNACFALPTASRVSTPNPTGVAVTTASETQVTSATCRSAFIQNGSNVIQFRSNGNIIGAKSTSAFKGLFYDGGTGTTFSQGSYEFTRQNGDIVVSYKKTDPTGGVTYDTFVLRLDGDGKLKQFGNQYAYPGGVTAYHQLRHFITLGQSPFDYYSTGYTLSVSDITTGTGVNNSIFDRVVVTTPRGNTLLLKPKVGYSNLELVDGSGTVLSSTFVRLNSVYADATNKTDPAVKDSASLFFADRTQFTDAVLAQIPAQAVWKFDYYLVGNVSNPPDATQYYKTRSRALTIQELQTKGLATMAASTISSIQSGANPSTGSFPGMLPISGQTSVPLSWSVNSGALPPTSIQLWGSYVYSAVTNGFDDSVGVSSTATTGSIQCSPTSGADHHCVGATGSAYTTPTYLNGAHLWARDPAGREFASYYAAYKLN